MYMVLHAHKTEESECGIPSLHNIAFPTCQALLALKYPGYYQGAASKWQKSRATYQWDVLMEKCPSIAAKYDEVPNWLRERLNINSAKGKGHGRIPPEVLEIVDSILKQAIQDGFELNMSSVADVLKEAIEAFNSEISKYRESRENADLKALDQLVETGASEAEITKLQDLQAANKASWPSCITCGLTDSALKHQAANFAESHGYSCYTQDKPTRHLPRDHPQVQHVNDFIKMNISEAKVDGRLVANFDQVWTCLYEPMRKTLWKRDPGTCESDGLSRFPGRQKIRATLQEHFGETVQLPLAERNKKWKVKLATIQGYGGNNTVNAWRHLLWFNRNGFNGHP